jgi:hypothetical protein
VVYTFLHIKAAIDSEDPEGLIAMGAPTDEYESEASVIEAQIAKVAADKVNVEQITDIVAEVWNSQFGPFDAGDLNKRRHAFSTVARKIVALR